MRLVCVCALVLLAAACDEKIPTTPSDAVTNGDNVALQTESFTGTVPLAGSVFYSFTVPRTGPISLTLLSLKEDGVDSSASVSIGVGTPVARTCLLNSGQIVPSGTSPQVITNVVAGVYCAAVTDPGNLISPGVFALNIAYPR